MNKNSRQTKYNIGIIIKGYFIFPVVFAGLILALAVAMFFMREQTAGLVCLLGLAAYVAALMIFIYINSNSLNKRLLAFAREYGGLEGELISDFPIPYVVTDPDGDILAYNKIFSRMYDDKSGQYNICQIFREIEREDLEFEGSSANYSVVYDKRSYRLCMRRIKVTKNLIDDKIVLLPKHNMTIYAIYLFDETEIVNMMRRGVEEQSVYCALLLDNFDDIMKMIPDVKKSLATALIEKEIGTYFGSIDGIVRKIERDRYFVLFKRKYLAGLQRTKFDLLDDIKKIDLGISQAVTISMGVGISEDYSKIVDYSQIALELALGRGGDQVVVKEGERLYFYGGKTKQAEKNTRVKARVTAISIREAIADKERVVIMGHKNGDIDSLGAAVGIYRIARELGKAAYIVINEQTTTVKPVLNEFLKDEEYRQNVFVSPESASAFVKQDTALIIVDVNKPDIFEAPELVSRTNTVLMIDHHLQSGDKIDNLILSYVEPGAGSASEMVVEILQYIKDGIKLKTIEAEALYAGILIDTDYFSKNTGVRTFEAAAYLKKNGVNIAHVQSLFSDTLETARIKAQAISCVEDITPGIVMTECPSRDVDNVTVLAAQIANELLGFRDVVISFVLTYSGGKVYISARSSGDRNVQLVMEKLGGGGHLNIAGAQLDSTMADAKKILKTTVKKMLDEGTLSVG